MLSQLSSSQTSMSFYVVLRRNLNLWKCETIFQSEVFCLSLPFSNAWAGWCTNFHQNSRVWFAPLFRYFFTATIHYQEWWFVYHQIMDDCKRASWCLEWKQFYGPRNIGAFECDKRPVWLLMAYNQVYLFYWIELLLDEIVLIRVICAAQHNCRISSQLTIIFK